MKLERGMRTLPIQHLSHSKQGFLLGLEGMAFFWARYMKLKNVF